MLRRTLCAFSTPSQPQPADRTPRRQTGLRFAWLAVACLCAHGANAQDGPKITEDLYPGQYTRGEETWIVSRVVDDLSGKPVVGATIQLTREHPTPLGGEFWSEREATTDAQGFFRMRMDDLETEHHVQVLRHPDQGVSSRTGSEPIWRVGKPFDVPIQIRDWKNQPVAGALVGFCGYCGHSPDLVHTKSDANGIAVMRGVDPRNDIGDIYVQHPGLALGYRSVEWRPGEPPQILWLPFRAAQKGTVIDHEGKPVAGAFVGSNNVHRGPWAKTDKDGKYTLLGSESPPNQIRLKPSFENEGLVVFDPPDVSPITVQLPEPKPKPEDEDEDKVVVLEATVQAPAIARAEAELVTVQIAAVSQPGDGDLSVKAFWPNCGSQSWTDDVVDLPKTGPFVLRVAPDDSASSDPTRVYSFENLQALPEQPLRLAYFPPTQITGTIVDEEGKAVTALARWLYDFGMEAGEPMDLEEPADCKDGTLNYATTHMGLALLHIVPENKDLQPRAIWVQLPDRAENATVDLGSVVLSKEPMLRVLGAGGKLLTDAIVYYDRPGLTEVDAMLEAYTTDDGAWRGPDLFAGDAVVVQLDEDAVPFRTLLVGDGPWTIELPTGAIDLKVVGPKGKTMPCYFLVDDLAIDFEGEHAVRGLALGKHEVVITAEGFRAALLTVDVTNEPQTLRVTLPLQ